MQYVAFSKRQAVVVYRQTHHIKKVELTWVFLQWLSAMLLRNSSHKKSACNSGFPREITLNRFFISHQKLSKYKFVISILQPTPFINNHITRLVVLYVYYLLCTARLGCFSENAGNSRKIHLFQGVQYNF